jgi:hypothetical protein
MYRKFRSESLPIRVLETISSSDEESDEVDCSSKTEKNGFPYDMRSIASITTIASEVGQKINETQKNKNEYEDIDNQNNTENLGKIENADEMKHKRSSLMNLIDKIPYKIRKKSIR